MPTLEIILLKVTYYYVEVTKNKYWMWHCPCIHPYIIITIPSLKLIRQEHYLWTKYNLQLYPYDTTAILKLGQGHQLVWKLCYHHVQFESSCLQIVTEKHTHNNNISNNKEKKKSKIFFNEPCHCHSVRQQWFHTHTAHCHSLTCKYGFSNKSPKHLILRGLFFGFFLL